MDHTREESIRRITSLDAMMVWLLLDHSESESLQHLFLLAYRTIFSIDDVIECLARLTEKRLLPTKNVRSFIFLWVNGYFIIDWKHKIILPKMLEYSKSIMDNADYTLLKNMCIKDKSIRRGPQTLSAPSSKTEHRSPKTLLTILSPSRPRSASADGTKEWSSISTSTLATQMTVMEQELFSDIQPGEFLRDAWHSTHREALAPRLSSLVKRFNDVSFWVATQVVMSSSVKHQTMTIRKFIKVAYKLFKFHNYNSLMQILSGLHNASVSRLKPAWAALPGNAQDKFKKMNEFMSADQNFQQYREVMSELSSSRTPALPYLVLFMRDITFIEENPDKTAEGHVNFLKLYRLGRQLHWFVHFSRSDYGFTMDFQIQKVLMDLKFLSDSELYDFSLASEPKNHGRLSPTPSSNGRTSPTPPSSNGRMSPPPTNHGFLVPRVSEIARGEYPSGPSHGSKWSSWRGKGKREKQKEGKS
eukprot:Phypoly_transcript_05556.p1 GENE.Phypoly_transcript_05556~~Phypoly_transcript_05556.p1  ORF type:complete len:473 (+),score=56.14 Phypoly_transcript_05556:324-1742(+)